MNTLELIEQFAERHGLTLTAAKKLFDGALSAISDAVAAGEEVALNGFGKFKVKHRPARTGRHPRTGAALKIAASKNVSFSPSKTLKTAMNGAPKKALTSKATAAKKPVAKKAVAKTPVAKKIVAKAAVAKKAVVKTVAKKKAAPAKGKK